MLNWNSFTKSLQAAALFGLENLAEWRSARRHDLLERITTMRQAYDQTSPRFELLSLGAFFAYLRHPWPEQDSVEVAKILLREQGLLCWPGSWFGDSQSAFIRLAFANLDSAGIEEMMARLGKI